MGKDPAVLWYWNDWQGGTMTLTRHLKGCYMDLLNAQFNNGRLSLAQIKTLLGNDYGPAWPILQEKFKRDDNDRYYNERAEFEKEKRVKYSESRRKNLKNSHMHSHMESHMENENRNGIVNEIRGKGTGKGVNDAEKEILKNPILLEQLAMNSGKTIEEAKSILHIYHLYQVENDKYPKTKKAVFAGFEKWLLNEKKKNGAYQQHTGQSTKRGTSEARIDRAKEW